LNKLLLGSVKDADQMVADMIEALAQTLEHFSLREVARDLDSDSRSRYLIVVLDLSTFVTVARKPATNNSRSRRLELQIKGLESVHYYISLFNAELGRQFAKDGRISIPDQNTDAAAA
jgi:hypothetical protein